MALSSDEKLKKMLGDSTLFSDNGGTPELNLENLTPEQAVALARSGRTGRVNTGKTPQGISGGMTRIENQILSQAGKELASGDSLIVPNVQRTKEYREDARSRGGVTQQSSGMNRSSLAGARSAGTTGSALGIATKSLNYLKKGSDIYKKYKDSKASGNKLMKINKIHESNPEIAAASGNYPIDQFTSDSLNKISGASSSSFLTDPSTSASVDYGKGGLNTLSGGRGSSFITDASEGVVVPRGLGSSSGLGATHAASLTGAGVSAGTVAAANAMGEGALNVAAAQSLSQSASVGTSAAGGAASASGSALSTIGSIMPYVGFALQGYNILSKGLGKRRNPTGLSSGQILKAADNIDKDPYGNDWQIVTDPETGNRYLKDPVTERNYGETMYHNLDDTKRMDSARSRYYRKSTALRGMDRGSREEFNQATDRGSRARFESGSKGTGINQLGGIRSDKERFNPSGESYTSITNYARGIQSRYHDYEEEQKDPGFGGLG